MPLGLEPVISVETNQQSVPTLHTMSCVFVVLLVNTPIDCYLETIFAFIEVE